MGERRGSRKRVAVGVGGRLTWSQIGFLGGMVMPVIALFIIIRVIPILVVLLMSFTNFSLHRPLVKFLPYQNFLRMFDDPNFITAFVNSTEFVLIAVPAEILLGLAFAVFLNRKVKFESLYETLYFLPYIVPMVPSAIIWKWIYAPGTYGLANYLLDQMGLPRVGWLSTPQISLLAVIGIHVWKQLGFFVIVFLVGLKNIPASYREAALVDGATPWQVTRNVDVPLLKPVILFGVVMATLWAWSAFTEVYIMSQGTDISTGAEIQVMVTRIYSEGFLYFKMGYASAISFALFCVSLIFVAFQFRLLRTEPV
ncbi:MAG: sugar ABC transporter permease [Desulfobacterales bacterium]|nr:MAG: sugar ABC transporter permease [Desulfobacterales bacterium]